MRAMQRIRAVFVVLAASLALTGCEFDIYKMPLPGGTDTGEQPITVTAKFRDVLDLVPKSTVKVNDVSVGKVTDIELDGYVATVTMELRNDVALPDNPIAELRQTSLLGEKFVQLEPPPEGGTGQLETGDVIGLDRTGRNPEVEEVLGALSLLLNGGGIAQMQTIARELNLALEGREGAARSVFRQIEAMMAQLDANKGDIVDAIESLNRLAIAVNDQTGSIDAALEELPSALTSLDRQRDDLVRMLKALNRLGDIGVRVIKASKQSTIESFRQLVPVLTELGNAGDDFANAFHVFLTYPFVDEVVGRDPQVARNLHMGDYTNLHIRMDINVGPGGGGGGPSVPADECIKLDDIPDDGPLPDLEDLCKGAADAINKCLEDPSPQNCEGLPGTVVEEACTDVELPALCPEGDGGGGGGGGGGGLPTAVPTLPRPGYGPTGSATDWSPRGPTMGDLMELYDPSLVSLLVPGMVIR